jgi:alpha 1,3-glucosidase
MAKANQGFISCISFLYLLLLTSHTSSLERNNFKTCDQSSFCKRNRALGPGSVKYVVKPESLVIEENGCKMDLVKKTNGKMLTAEIYSVEDNMFRVKINEKDSIRQRYEVVGALVDTPKLVKCKVHRSSDGVQITAVNTQAVVNFDPFRIDVSINGEIAVVLNSRELLNFETYRIKNMPVPSETKDGGEGDEQQQAVPTDADHEDQQEPEHHEEEEHHEEGLWEETFKTHHDSKPYGPSSISMDISFPGVEHVYGIPEHSDSLALKSTNNGDPYRLFNLDVAEYEVNNPMALYGSIPVMLAHNWSKTIGVFWHNAAETWIDITSSKANQNILGKLISIFKNSDEVPQTDTRWVSESGIIDVFIMLGPRPYDVFRQYSTLTGKPALPPLFSVAYHQCRWNYNDEEDVANVDSQLDQHDFPYDVLWLDIEHTNGRRYMTWDTSKFPSPAEMQNKLATRGRKMVTIVDPHIKKDSGYHLHKEAEERNLFVRNKDGGVYEGWCWPGTSSWIDFLNPDARKWWSEQFAVDKYDGSTLNLFTWNDMNEPSVFNGPELTMHKDAKHFGEWENRDVHNIYGMLLVCSDEMLVSAITCCSH